MLIFVLQQVRSFFFYALFSSKPSITYLFAVSYEHCFSKEPFILAIAFFVFFVSSWFRNPMWPKAAPNGLRVERF